MQIKPKTSSYLYHAKEHRKTYLPPGHLKLALICSNRSAPWVLAIFSSSAFRHLRAQSKCVHNLINNLIQPDDQQFKHLHVPAAMCSSDDHNSQVGMLFLWSHKDLLINLDITNMITYILMIKKKKIWNTFICTANQNLVTINEELLPTLHLNDWTHITGRYLSDFTASSATTNGTDLDYRTLLKNVSLS